jgi:hypothetical protein
MSSNVLVRGERKKKERSAFSSAITGYNTKIKKNKLACSLGPITCMY